MKLAKTVLLCLLSAVPVFGILAQDSAIDLWDMWREGFEKYESAEKQMKKDNPDEALELYRQSMELFRKIKKASPEWNKDVVSYRLSLCDRRISAIETPRKEAAALAEVRRQSDIQALNKEVDDLRAQLKQARIDLIDAKSAADRNALSEKQVKKLMDENSALQKKLAAAEANVETLKADLVKADKSVEYKKEILDLNTRLDRINRDLGNRALEIETLKMRCQDYLGKRNEAETQVRRLTEKLAELDVKTAEAEALSKENRKLAEALAQVKKASDEISGKLAESLKKTTELESTLEGLESGKVLPPSVRKLQEELALEKKNGDYLRDLSARYKLENDTLKSDFGKKDAEYKKLVMELVKTTEALAKLRADNDAVLKQNEEYRKQAATGEVLAKENAVLKQNIDAIATKYGELRDSLKDADANAAKLLTLSSELEKTKKILAAMSSELEKSKAAQMSAESSALEKKALAEANLVLKRDLANAGKAAAEAAELQSRTAKDYAATLAEAKALQTNLSAKYNSLKTEYDKLAASATVDADLAKKFASLQTEYDKLVEKVRSSASSETELARLRKDMLQEKTARTAAEDGVARLKEENAALTKAKDSALASSAVLKKQYDSLLARPVTETEAFSALQKKLADAEKALADAKAASVETESLRKALADAKTASMETENLRKNSLASAEKLEALGKELAAAKASAVETGDLRKALADSLAECKRISDQNTSLGKEIADLRVAAGTASTLQKSVQSLQKSLAEEQTKNAELAKLQESSKAASEKSDSVLATKTAELEKTLAELKSENIRLVKSVEEKEAALRKASDTTAGTAELQRSVEVLKKALASAQEESSAVSKALAVLKLDHSDLEAKLRSMAPAADLASAKAESSALRKDFASLKASSLETEAALKTAESTIREQRKRLESFSGDLDPSAKKRIDKLSATVTELLEAKTQYESAVRSLTDLRDRLTEENKALKLSNSALTHDLAKLKEKPLSAPEGEDARKANELLERALRFESLYKETEAKRADLQKKQTDLSAEAERLAKELDTARTSAERYRNELVQWSDDPSGENEKAIARKDQAIDSLVKEIADLRKELDTVHTELTMSKDQAVKFKNLSIAIANNLRVSRTALAQAKTTIARLSPESALVPDEEPSKTANGEQTVAAASVEVVPESAGTSSETESSAISKHDEKRFRSAMNEGERHEKKGNWDDALMAYWRAADANPNDPSVHFKIAKMYLKRVNRVSAAKAYDKAVKLGFPRDTAFETDLQNLVPKAPASAAPASNQTTTPQPEK